jgi:tRNA-splicing ligase RtcB
MAPKQLTPTLWSWASEIDDVTVRQAQAAARLPIIAGHVALMPDAHLGKGATVGSVIPTLGAVIPAAVGVDIGCGMIAVETDLGAAALPDTLAPMLSALERAVPAGMGPRGERRESLPGADAFVTTRLPHTELTDAQKRKVLGQYGTLGSGNHFLEVCLDERDVVWVVLHSGSRGVGNQLATQHIRVARRLAHTLSYKLSDADLAWLSEGTREFDAYIADMLWAQDYARANREAMMDAALAVVLRTVGCGRERGRVNCHHNFTQREVHDGRPVWLTRKGAIKADVGDRGVIPGSMGAATYVVEGLGNAASFASCSHGAGRRLSRTAARKRFDGRALAERMAGRTWQARDADALVDEIPDAYKDIDAVMADQADLVRVQHTLRQVLNMKGT